MSGNNTSRLVLTIAVMAVLCGILFAGWWAVLVRIEKTRVAIREARGIILSLERERTYAHDALEILEARKGDIERTQQLLVDSEKPIEFIERLERIARETNNSVLLDVDGTGKGSGFLTFRLTIEGSEKSVFRYLSLLELIPYIIEVEDFSFQNISRESSALAGKSKGASRIPTARILLLMRVRTSS